MTNEEVQFKGEPGLECRALYPVGHSMATSPGMVQGKVLCLEEETSFSLLPSPHTAALPSGDYGSRERIGAPTKKFLRSAVASQLPCLLVLHKAIRTKGLFILPHCNKRAQLL